MRRRVKHGRRHDSLKERVYATRYRQGAQGYARGYDAIDVARPATPPAPPPDATPLAAALDPKAKRALRRAGIDPETP